MSDGSESSGSDIWSKVGKVGAAVVGLFTVIGVILGILNYVYQKEEKLSATGVYSKFQFPDKVEDDLFGYKTSWSSEIRNIIEASVPKEANEKYVSYYDAAEKVAEYVNNKQKSRDDALELVQRFTSFIEVQVVNSGSRQAENVTLEISGSGFYQIKDFEQETLKDFKNSISLGSLHPSVKKQIYIWNNSSFSSFDKSLVTYTNGAEPIVFKQDNPDQPFSVLNYFSNPIILSITVLVFLLTGIFIGEKGKAGSRNSQAKKDDQPLPVPNNKESAVSSDEPEVKDAIKNKETAQ